MKAIISSVTGAFNAVSCAEPGVLGVTDEICQVGGIVDSYSAESLTSMSSR